MGSIATRMVMCSVFGLNIRTIKMVDPVCIILYLQYWQLKFKLFYPLIRTNLEESAIFSADGKSRSELEPPVLHISIYSELKHVDLAPHC